MRIGLEVGDGTARLLHDDSRGRPVPRTKAALVVAVQAAGGEPAEIERGRSGTADVPNPANDAAKDLTLFVAPFSVVSETRCDQRCRQWRWRRDPQLGAVQRRAIAMHPRKQFIPHG